MEARVGLDTPINVHLTGCPNSCAQHYIGDIGLIACRVPIADSDDTVEGFHVHVGGGFGADAAIAREIYRDVKVEDCPSLIERMLKAYLANRAGTRDVHAVQSPHGYRCAQGHGRRTEERRMTIQEARTGSVPVIPDGAPFSMEQRAWLNGFFAGLLSLDAKAGISPLDRRTCPMPQRRPWPATAMTARRPGTMRPCPSTSACSWPRAVP